MKKAFMLAGLILCVSAAYAETVEEGRKRNEEAYERILEQTGWKKAEAPLSQPKNS